MFGCFNICYVVMFFPLGSAILEPNLYLKYKKEVIWIYQVQWFLFKLSSVKQVSTKLIIELSPQIIYTALLMTTQTSLLLRYMNDSSSHIIRHRIYTRSKEKKTIWEIHSEEVKQTTRQLKLPHTLLFANYYIKYTLWTRDYKTIY